MSSEILSSPSEIDEEFETPHDCSYRENETIGAANEVNDISESSSFEEKIDESKFEEQTTKLEERLQELKDQMFTLKEQLVEEKVAWQKEIEEAMKVARSVGVGYKERDQQYIEMNPKADIELDTAVNEPTLSELAILDYENKLATYQEALTKAHAEKRNILKRQLAANAYKRRLLEVEKLCNMELLKVKQSVQYLQPLQALASTWDNTALENPVKFDDELTGNVAKIPNETKSPVLNGDGLKPEFVTMEDLENKIFNDLKDISTKLATTSSVLNDEDDLMKNRIMSMGWYNNELGSHLPFNPLM